MYGEHATKLIRRIRHGGDLIPPYDYELVKSIMRENDELYAENLRTSQSASTRPSEISDTDAPETSGTVSTNGIAGKAAGDIDLEDESRPDSETANNQDDLGISEKDITVMQIRHAAKLWNKRCLIAYHYERLNRLKTLRWAHGEIPKELLPNVTKDELNWFVKYNENLFAYMNALNDGQGLDLTLYMNPPKKLRIQFKCVRDYGQIDIDGELYLLKKDHLYYLPLSKCEKLVHQGVLEHFKNIQRDTTE